MEEWIYAVFPAAGYEYAVFALFDFERSLRIAVELLHERAGIFRQFVNRIFELADAAFALGEVHGNEIHFFESHGEDRAAERIQFAVVARYVELKQPVQKAAAHFFPYAVPRLVRESDFGIFDFHFRFLLIFLWSADVSPARRVFACGGKAVQNFFPHTRRRFSAFAGCLYSLRRLPYMRYRFSSSSVRWRISAEYLLFRAFKIAL